MALPLSSDPLNVAARTLTGSNPSHSLKTAETAARHAHTCQGFKPATEASGGFWRVISAAYGLGKNRSRPNGLHHLVRNGLHRLARTSEHQLARTSDHQLARTSEHHKPEPLGLLSKPSTSKGEELAQASKGEELARQGRHHKPRRTSRHHTRPARVGITNPGAQFFILKAANPRMIRGFYGVQFFISEKLINSTFVLLCGEAHSRMDLPRYEPSRTLDTTLAGSKFFS